MSAAAAASYLDKAAGRSMTGGAGAGVLGIDVGGTKIAAGIVDPATGAILARETIATEAARGGIGRPRRHASLSRGAWSQRRGSGSTASASACRSSWTTPGRIRSAYNFDWTDLPVRERLSTLAPTTIESDVRAAARAEAAFGAGKGRRVFVYVTIGTGVSYCLVIDGRPHAGANGFAIHFASSALHIPCEACGHVNAPVLEEIASGPAISAAYARPHGSQRRRAPTCWPLRLPATRLPATS